MATKSKVSRGKKTINNEQASVLQSMRDLFNQPAYSDLVIRSGDHTWRVHKNIICARSDYFEKICGGQFKESSQGEINLKEDFPPAVEAMLLFLYSGDYNDSLDTPNTSKLLLNIHICNVADKYAITSLGKVACFKFQQGLDDVYSPRFAEAVCNLWTDQPKHQDMLRASVISAIVINIKGVCTNDLAKELRELIATMPGLGLELLVEQFAITF